MQKIHRLIELSRRIYRDHDWPFEPLGRMHCRKRDGFRIGVGAALNVLLCVVPVRPEGIRKSNKTSGFIGAGHLQNHLYIC